jgi:hypothetical protein
MWDTTDVGPLRVSDESKVKGESIGIPHLAKSERDTRISCTRPSNVHVCGFH